MKKSKKLLRKFFAVALAIISLVSPSTLITASAAEVYSDIYINGFCMVADHDYIVYSSPQLTSSIGKIFYKEGFTVLCPNRSSGYMWVEYNTTSGPTTAYPQIGYVENESVLVRYTEDFGQICCMFIEYNASGRTKSGYIFVEY